MNVKNGYKETNDLYRPEFHGSRFSITVTDGNGRDWLFHSVTPIGPVAVSQEMPEAICSEMKQALEDALQFLRNRPTGPAKIMEFKRGPKA